MKSPITSKIAGLALNLILLAGWLWLYWPVLQTLPTLLTGEDFRTNQMMLTAIAALLLYRVHKTRTPWAVDATPHFFLPGFTLLLFGSVGYLLSERLLTISSISTSLFVLASYGLLGLWLSPQRWRAGLPMMLLVVGVLPFGPQMESFVGYPLRIFTASLVRDLLAGLGFHTVGVDTILVFENGVSQVDIPCSGVKSLWTGALFLLGATWVENRPLTGRWWLVAVGMALLLVLANFLRVAILSITGPALGLTELARMIHVPLCVLGFAGACAAALFLLGQLKETTKQNTDEPLKPRWLRPVLSTRKTTDDYSQPIWDTLTSQRERWVLVTVLFDQDYASQPAELNPFFEALHNSVNISLQKGVIQ